MRRIGHDGFKTLPGDTIAQKFMIHREIQRKLRRLPGDAIRLRAAEAVLIERWSDYIKHDPYYHPELTRQREDFSLDDYEGPRGVLYDQIAHHCEPKTRWLSRLRHRTKPASIVAVHLVVERLQQSTTQTIVAGWCVAGKARPRSLQIFDGDSELPSTIRWHDRCDVAEHHELDSVDVGFVVFASTETGPSAGLSVVADHGIRFALGDAAS